MARLIMGQTYIFVFTLAFMYGCSVSIQPLPNTPDAATGDPDSLELTDSEATHVIDRGAIDSQPSDASVDESSTGDVNPLIDSGSTTSSTATINPTASTLR